ncbi:MAG: UvrD-helicase domain-containing protein, partial [Muribaculaceae bacterium]|nr:UvrD-helicase domain-containing protein [Muribaculaceae bacterium]
YAFNYIFRYIDRYRRDNNLIVLADTNSLLGAIISESDTPFIYERVGVELDNFLIDEFQDTSRLQWHNLKPLLSNSLSAENDNLIIGDVKQSIYRFRGGDPSLLGSQVASRDFPYSHTIRGDRPGENTNYRSSHQVVRFNNSLFTRIAADCGVPGYDSAAQSLGRSMDGVPGYVALRYFTDDRLDANVARFFTPDEAGALADTSPRYICYTLMARDIRRQINSGYRPDEIAILCRSNSEASDIAEFLMASYPDIHIVSDEALKICNSHAVKLIVSVLEIIDKSYAGRERPDAGIIADSSLIDTPPAGGEASGPEPPSPDDEARARRYANRRRRAMLVDSFEYYMARGRDVEEALQLALDSSAEAMDRLTSLPDADRAPSPLFDDLDRIRRIAPSNLAALVEAIIDLKIPHDERARQLPYIAAFVDIVEAYTRDFVPSVHSFLAYWNERKHEFSISSGSSSGAVTIITVHKAKGLEWPCVHIPAVSWPVEAAVSSMWFDLAPLSAIPADIRPPIMQLSPGEAFRRPQCPLAPQYLAAQAENTADNLNVAYVAFTRAVRELHISFVSDVNPRTRSLLHISDAVAKALAAPVPPVHDDIYADFAAGLDSDGNYTLGEPTQPRRNPGISAADTADNVPPPVFDVSFNPLNRQLTRLADLTVADDIADDPDIGNNAPRDIVDEPVNQAMEQAARKGIVLHSILQRMYTVDDLDRAVDYHRPYIGEAYELDEYRDLISRAFALGGPHPQRWFASGNTRVLAEQAIFHRPSGLFRRADRIVWTDPGVVEVIDYKFTSAPRPTHYGQIRDYAAMLATMNLGTIRAFLWYPLLNRVIEVDIH